MTRNILARGLSFFIVFVALHGFGQTAPNVNQQAKNTACSNIVALAGDVSINCSSLTPAQSKLIESIPAVLNKILANLANQPDPKAVEAKLDEILGRLKTIPKIRDFDVRQFQEKLREYHGPQVAVTIDGDTLSPFVMKVSEAFGVTGPNLINNGTYKNPLTIQFGEGAKRAAEFVQAAFDSFSIAATIEPFSALGSNRIRIRVAAQ